MRRAIRGALAALLVAAALPAAAAPAPTPQAVTPADQIVERRGQLMISGKPLRYTTRTGLMPLYDNDTGELIARMLFVAYVADRAPGEAPRPLTFVWNGGPGSSASQVHLVGFGPKGFKAPATYPEWKGPPTEIVDRPETWLSSSDLVFVDPIGTGYSRATSEAWRDVLYTRTGDAEAVAELIRLYRTRYDAFDAPLFLAGESYGTTRAMEVAGVLARRRTPVAGVVLISGEYEVGQQVPAGLQAALEVPLFAATAWYHKRLPPDLQTLPRDALVARATAWAKESYARALERKDTLTPAERTALLAELQRFTAVDSKYVDAQRLTLSKADFMDHLLDATGEELGRYDSRMVVKQRDPSLGPWLPTSDPSLAPMIGIMQGTSVPMIRYIRDVLGYRSDLMYRGPFGEAFHPKPLVASPRGLPDDWMAAMWENGLKSPAPDARPAPKALGQSDAPPLRRAMDQQPNLIVFNVRGLYDISCAAADEAVARSPAGIRERVRNRCYAAGHMLYTDEALRRDLARDFDQFVRDGAARWRP